MSSCISVRSSKERPSYKMRRKVMIIMLLSEGAPLFHMTSHRHHHRGVSPVLEQKTSCGK
jgi:hypothetical protein